MKYQLRKLMYNNELIMTIILRQKYNNMHRENHINIHMDVFITHFHIQKHLNSFQIQLSTLSTLNYCFTHSIYIYIKKKKNKQTNKLSKRH